MTIYVPFHETSEGELFIATIANQWDDLKQEVTQLEQRMTDLKLRFYYALSTNKSNVCPIYTEMFCVIRSIITKLDQLLVLIDDNMDNWCKLNTHEETQKRRNYLVDYRVLWCTTANEYIKRHNDQLHTDSNHSE